MNKKLKKYQDYVIKDGKLIGEFERMYQDHNDPWEQSLLESKSPDKLLAASLIKAYGFKRILELGCGLGYFTNLISCTTDNSVNILGTDISKTAIEKSNKIFGNKKVRFQEKPFNDQDVVNSFKPDVIIFPEITWYILDEFKTFLDFLKSNYPDIIIIHILTFYPVDQQKYGKDFFTSHEELLEYTELKIINHAKLYSNNPTYRSFIFGGF